MRKHPWNGLPARVACLIAPYQLLLLFAIALRRNSKVENMQMMTMEAHLVIGFHIYGVFLHLSDVTNSWICGSGC